MRHTSFPTTFKVVSASALVLIPLVLTGCDDHYHDDDHDHYDSYDRRAPLPPVGVISITGDRTVFLEWYENQEPDLAGYRVYVSDHPDGPYDFISFTPDADYTDRDLANGETYYYGVSAIDHDGNESDLNLEVIYDTPRPEGSVVINEADSNSGGGIGDDSAFDFSRERLVRWDDASADVYFDVVDGIAFLVVPDTGTDIQDAGYLGFDDLTWAPVDGWAPSGAVEAIEGHVYIVWTRDDHYAKVRVIDVTSGDIDIDYGYQVDPGNQELRGTETATRPTFPQPRPRLTGADKALL